MLILGSGNTYHNLGVMRRALRGDVTDIHGREFDAWLSETVAHPDAAERARRWSQWFRALGARDAHPREEHLIPLLVAAGAAGTDRGAKCFEDCVMGVLESAFRFG